MLGIYIRDIAKNSRVVLLSPSRLSSKNTLKHLNDVSRETFQFYIPQSFDLSVSLQDIRETNYIIVDEAASINREILEKISQFHNAKIIFSTTIDGYEGTGQSYRLSYLNQQADNIIRLTEPKRFSPNDLLYRLSQQLCQPINNEKIHVTDGVSLFSSKIMQEKGLLLPTFSLLQAAHYRTTPNDFANFYDDNTEFITCIKDKKLIGATHLLKETLSEVQETPTLITDIINGKRRVKNAMTQQALLNAYGGDNEIDKIATTNILRISRIATDSDYRRQGVATEMINHLTDMAIGQKIDFISTSFSGKPETLQFWLSQSSMPVRIGVNKNKWHNEFALLMLKPLSVNGKAIIKPLQQYFIQHYRYYQQSYRYQDRALSKIIERNIQVDNLTLFSNTDSLINAIDSVVFHHRDIHWILPMVDSWVKVNRKVLSNDIDNVLETLLTGEFLDKKNKSNAVNTLLLFKNYIYNAGLLR